jgi:hypothetical protein
MSGGLTVRLWPVTGAPPTSYAYMNDTGVQPRRSPATDKQVNNLRVRVEVTIWGRYCRPFSSMQ